MSNPENGPESREVFRLNQKSTGILAFICTAVVILMFGYCFYVSVVGIQNDGFFFNFVELAPLGIMMVICWISWLFRPRKPQH